MPAVNSAGKTGMDQTDRPWPPPSPRSPEADLGGRVEAEAEQETERIHVPAPADEAEQWPKEAADHAAAVQQFVQRDLIEAATFAGLAERRVDVGQHDHVDRRDDEQEQRRHRRADDAAHLPEFGEPGLDRRGRERNRGGGRDHHGRMAERKEQTDGHRPLAILHELAGDIVDCGDVVGIDRVTQPERVRDDGAPEQHRMVVEEQERGRPGGAVRGEQDGVDPDDAVP
jgi:hypothetical protein